MTDRFVTVPDSLELPAAVKVGVDRLHDSTAAGRALLTGADAAAQRSSLGLGTAATASVGDFEAAGTTAAAFDVVAVDQITLTAPLALTVPAGFPAGQVYRVALTQDGTGGHAVTYGGSPVTVDTAAGASTLVEFFHDGTAWEVRTITASGLLDTAAATSSAAMASVDVNEAVLNLTTARRLNIDTYTDGILQVETATAAGTVTADPGGTAIVTITSKIVAGSPLAVNVPLLLNDGPAQIAAKIRAALAATPAVTAAFTVSGATDKVVLTALAPADNDTTANITIAPGTATGVATANTSTNTTFGSLNEIVHPSVLYFPEAWNGFKWWMAYTPYDNGLSIYENPSLAVSNDNVTWITPPGVTNPIEPRPNPGFNSDPHLFMSADGRTMHMVWKFAHTDATIYLRSSEDGVTWTPKVPLFTNTNEHVSPTVILDAGTFKMWTVKHSDTPNNIYLRTATDPAGPWSDPVLCTYTLPAGVEPWHMDVKKMGSEYHMILCDATYAQAFFGKSTDGLAWTFSPRLNAGVYSTYRSALVPLTTDRGFGWGVYYGRPGPWRVEYTELTFDKSRRDREVWQDIGLAKLKIAPWVLCDTFDRADSAASLGTADSGQTWTAASGGAVGVLAGQAYIPGSAGVATVDLGAANFYLEFTVVNSASGANGAVFFRRANATSQWRFTHAGERPELAKTVAGVTTYYGLPSMYPLNPGVRIGIYCNGSTINIYRNRMLADSRVDSDLLAGTLVGLSPESATARYDNIIAKTL